MPSAFRRPSGAALPACLTFLLLAGCGARSSLDDGSTSSTQSPASDPCRAAISGPQAMAGNCSTRDGRSRVAAPTAPHLTWSTKLPTDSTGQIATGAIATDPSGNAYVVTTCELGEANAALRRVRADDGSLFWTTSIAPDQETGAPILLASGGIDLFAYDAAAMDAIFTFDRESGASTSTTFGFSLYEAPANPAVGADGSLYLTHEEGVGTAKQTTYVSRIGKDGKVLWTSVDLATLGPTPLYDDGFISPSILALGNDDLPILMVGVLTQSSNQVVALAFDPATGAPRWTTAVPGSVAGGPAIRPDGTIVALVSTAAGSNLLTLDPQTGSPTLAPLATNVFQIHAITEAGAVLASQNDGSGVTALVALGTDGSPLWTNPGDQKVTVASNGTILSYGSTLRAIDASSGKTLWDLPPPNPDKCILNAALTPTHQIVALQCDGTLFAASD